ASQVALGHHRGLHEDKKNSFLFSDTATNIFYDTFKTFPPGSEMILETEPRSALSTNTSEPNPNGPQYPSGVLAALSWPCTVSLFPSTFRPSAPIRDSPPTPAITASPAVVCLVNSCIHMFSAKIDVVGGTFVGYGTGIGLWR
ncbi:hypothetical protein EIP91_000374, partial [Steccherinum ochraceum]